MKGDYTKEMYKKEIHRILLEEKYDAAEIAEHTSKIFFLHLSDIDLELYDKMLDVMTMDNGPEFELTEEEFKDFLDNM